LVLYCPVFQSNDSGHLQPHVHDMLIEAGVFKFQITQSVFYDVDTTSAKNRRSVKLNLENVRSLPRRRENDMRYSAKQLSALATVSYSLKGTVVVIW